MRRNRAALDGDRRDRCRGGRRWRAEQAEQVMNAWRESGLSKVEFARHHGLKIERLERWFSKLERSNARKSPDPVFRPVRLKKPQPAQSGGTVDLEVLIGEDIRLRLRPGFDAKEVERLIRVLRC